MKRTLELNKSENKKKIKKAQDRALNASKMHSFNSIEKKYEDLKKKIQIIEAEYQKKIEELKQNCTEIIKDKENKFLQKLSEINNERISFPKEVFERYPILHDMILYSIGAKPSTEFFNFCQLFFLINKNSYLNLSNFLPIVPERTMYESFSAKRTLKHQELTDIKFIPSILTKNYRFDKDDATPQKIHLTLGGDAASVKLIPGTDNSAIYTFMAIPLQKQLKPLPIFIFPTKSGTSSPIIVDLSKKITYIIEKNGQFIVDFVATDGDRGFDYCHRDFFAIIEPILNEKISFIEKIQKLINLIHIPINDPLHLFKNGRSHLLNHPLMVDPESLRIVNVNLLKKATQLEKEIEDKSSISAMKDFYALSLFSWDSFYKTIQNDRYDAAFYFLPFTFFIEIIKSNILNKFERLKLLENSIKYLQFHLRNVRNCDRNSFFTPSYHIKSIGTLFGEDIFIIRFINTCVGHSISLLRNDEIAFSRISSHDVEGHYGIVRIFSHFNHSYENAVNATIYTCLFKEVCLDMKYKYNIKKE